MNPTHVVAAIACSVAISTAPSPASPSGRAATAAALRAQGLEFGYNLDYSEAITAFEQALDVDPEDATAHRLAAAIIWMRILFLQGAVTVEEYLGQARSEVFRVPPPAHLSAAFDDHIDKAFSLAEARTEQAPFDADAHFQLGAAAALRTTYIATIKGKVSESLGSGRRAYKEHKRTLLLDPTRKDAALIVGMYRYTVASLSPPLRFMARLAGFEGGREAGLRLVEEAAAYPGAAQTNARLTLMLMYNREGRYEDALRVARQLQQRYPRNRLLWLEEGSTALRARRALEALAAIDNGLALFASDTRPKAFGEEAQWRLQRGAALVALRDIEAARG
jgi:tetratricopeptide (TPR) repeat protein